MKVAGTPMYKCYQDIGAAGGWIKAIQRLVWVLRLIQRTFRVCRVKGINQAHFDLKGHNF